MIYQDFRLKLEGFEVFALADIRKFDPKFYRHQLNEWQNKGYLTKLRRGYYMFADTALNESALSLIANRLYAPSYVSFESALSRYGLIPEGVYTMTSASTRKTSAFATPVGNFYYRQVKPSLFFGYRLEQYNGQGVKIAEMEKAVLDYLYLNPRIVEEEEFHEWRFNGAEFLANANEGRLRQYAAAFGGGRFMDRVEIFLSRVRSQR